jgi:NADPH:quinone reductase-like Zn-dependent oxidoreductase
MNAIVIHNFGGPEQLKYEKVAVPEPAKGEILVEINSIGINPYDWKFREGLFKAVNSEQISVIPGIEASGVISAIGAGVTKFIIGQEVYGHVRGSYAEYALTAENHLFHKPETISFEEAAAIPVGSQTAWSTLFDIAELRKGQTVLIHGGAGNVGMFAVQLAKWAGAKVITTVSSENVEFAKSLGADEVIDYSKNKFEELVNNVDVVLDTVGGQVQENSFKVLKKGGILVSIVSEPSKNLAEKYGVLAKTRFSGISKDGLSKIEELVEQKIIKPEIRKVFKLAEAAKAQELSRTGHGRGKIILKNEEI